MSTFQSKDFAAGLMFVGLGGGAAFVAQGYETGTISELGPGFVPMAAALLIMLLGGVLVVRTVLAGSEEEIEAIRILPVICVVLSAVAFGLTIESLGLVCAIAIMTLVASLGGARRSTIQYAALTVVLCLIAYLIFVLGLGIPLKVWPF